MNPRVDTTDLRALWMRFWPARYPSVRADWVLAGARLVVLVALLVGGYLFGGTHLAPQWPFGGAVIGHGGGMLLGLLLAIVADTAARDQGQRVGRWQMSEHYRLQAANRQADAPAAPVSSGADRWLPDWTTPAPVPEMVGAGRRQPGRNTGGRYRFPSAGPLPTTGAQPAVVRAPNVEPEKINDVIYALVGDYPGVNGMALRALLRDNDIEIDEKTLRDHLWQLTALLFWLSYTDGAFEVFDRPELGADEWPGLTDVVVRFVVESGDRGLDLTDVLTMLADRGAVIPRARVQGALGAGTAVGRIRLETYTGRYHHRATGAAS